MFVQDVKWEKICDTVFADWLPNDWLYMHSEQG